MYTPSSDAQMRDINLHPENYSLGVREDGQPEIRRRAIGPKAPAVPTFLPEAQRAGEVVLRKLAVTPDNTYLKACAQLIVSKEHEGEITSELRNRLQAILTPPRPGSTRVPISGPKAAAHGEPEVKIRRDSNAGAAHRELDEQLPTSTPSLAKTSFTDRFRKWISTGGSSRSSDSGNPADKVGSLNRRIDRVGTRAGITPPGTPTTIPQAAAASPSGPARSSVAPPGASGKGAALTAQPLSGSSETPPEKRMEVRRRLDDQGRCIIYDPELGKEFFFKPLRAGQKAAIIEAEIAASGLAHRFIGDLVPASKRVKIEGREGIEQEVLRLATDYLPGAMGREGEVVGQAFDIGKLNERQLAQLYAHSLVDWVISNTDDLPSNYGVDVDGNIVAFDKADAFQFLNGTQFQAKKVAQGIESSLPRGKPADFHDLSEDREIHVHALLRFMLRKGRIRVNYEEPIIQQTMKNIASLTKEELRTFLFEYARQAIPGQEEAFINSIWDRCQDLPRAVATFRALPPI